MLIARITGGLGNQLFQYAAARTISIQLNRKLLLDNSWYSDILIKNEHIPTNATTLRNFILNYFNIRAPVINKVHLNWIKRLDIRSKYSIFFKFLLDGPMSNFAYEKINPSNFSLEAVKKFRRTYLTGYWQNYDTIDDYKHIISKDFVLKNPLSENNTKYFKSLSTTNSVAVHFRRGDYISNPKYRKLYAPCSKHYYQNGIKLIQKSINNPHFYIFSDDINWVKNNYDFTTDTTFIDNSGPEYEHLFLMSSCNHQITANSTFSWWAAWLNTNPHKIIITPLDWYYDKHLSETVTRIPDEWIKIDNLI